MVDVEEVMAGAVGYVMKLIYTVSIKLIYCRFYNIESIIRNK